MNFVVALCRKEVLGTQKFAPRRSPKKPLKKTNKMCTPDVYGQNLSMKKEDQNFHLYVGKYAENRVSFGQREKTLTSTGKVSIFVSHIFQTQK